MSEEPTLIARIASSVGSLPAQEWDALAGTDNPFVSHAFLTALEGKTLASVAAPSLSFTAHQKEPNHESSREISL